MLRVVITTKKTLCNRVPPPPGVRSDLEIMQGLAARTGLEHELAGTAADHDPAQRRDVAVMAKVGGFFAGRSANVLLRGAVTDMGESGALYGERVRLVATEP